MGEKHGSLGHHRYYDDDRGEEKTPFAFCILLAFLFFFISNAIKIARNITLGKFEMKKIRIAKNDTKR